MFDCVMPAYGTSCWSLAVINVDPVELML